MKKHMFTILSGLLLFFGLQMQAQNIDAKHYEIHLNHFDFTEKTIEAETFVTFEVLEQTQSVVLELKSLEVSSVTCDDADVSSFSQEDDNLVINFSAPLDSGSEITLDIVYGGRTFNESWGGVHWSSSSSVYNLGVGISTVPHNLGKSWFPCVDNFEDKANYDVFVTTPSYLNAVCGGSLIETITNEDGTLTRHWSEEQPISTYHISFAVDAFDPWEDIYHGLNGDIPITVYTNKSLPMITGSFVHIKEIVQFFENCFGPYPFNRIGYVGTSQGCMEHIDNIALVNSMINGNTNNEEYIAHELSHMWFGNKVTCATAEDMWLNEGFAQFCGMFYTASVYDEATFQDAMSELITTITTWSNNEQNWIPLNQIPLDMTYDTKAVYDRGAVIVNTLMNYLGREKFLELFRKYFEQHEYQAMSSEQLRDFLSANNDFPLDDFFNTYVFTPGMPHYDLQLVDVRSLSDSTFETTLKLNYRHIGSTYVCPKNRVEVTLLNAVGECETRLVDFPEDGIQTITTLNFVPVAAFVDYNNRFLDGKTDRNYMLTTSQHVSFANFSTEIQHMTDPTMLRVENHLIGPSDDPEIPALTISTKHYWKIFRQDYGENDIQGDFVYSTSTDGDIILSENDSATILYRANANEPWREIQHTLHPQSSWRMGQIFVDNLPSGEYCIAVWDRELLGVAEMMENQRMKVYPNPAENQINIQLKDFGNGQIVICDSQGKTVKQIAFEQSEKMTIATEDLAKGLYLVKRTDENGTVLETETLIIK